MMQEFRPILLRKELYDDMKFMTDQTEGRVKVGAALDAFCTHLLAENIFTKESLVKFGRYDRHAARVGISITKALDWTLRDLVDGYFGGCKKPFIVESWLDADKAENWPRFSEAVVDLYAIKWGKIEIESPNDAREFAALFPGVIR